MRALPRSAGYTALLSFRPYRLYFASNMTGVAIGIEAIAVALFLAGCAKTTLITSALAGMQRHVPEHLRGRIMTI